MPSDLTEGRRMERPFFCRVHGSAVDFGKRNGHAALLLDRMLQTGDVFAQD